MTYDEIRHIATCAYNELLNQPDSSIAADLRHFYFPCHDIIIESYQRYAALTGCSISELSGHGKNYDGYVNRNIRPGLHLILYNQIAYRPRMRFTVAHEIGHIRLEHRKHTNEDESQAHYFAAELLSPTVLIEDIKKRGYIIEPRLLRHVFYLSEECAYRRMEDLFKFNEIRTECDSVLLEKYRECLNYTFGWRVNRSVIDIARE